MKAYVLRGVGDLRLEELPEPSVPPGWALVKVLSAGICSSDIPRIFVNGTYHFPTIPGHEFCGVVASVADEKDKGWIGKRVGVFPLIPCRRCPSCEKGEYETCSSYDYIGSRRDGAFAELVAAPVWNLIELPDTVSGIQGALLEPASVALHAVRRLGRVDSVCVTGTGAIGMLAGRWALLNGAKRVCVKGRNETKRLTAERYGLEYITEPSGETFSGVIEAVGTAEALEESLKLAAPGGKVVLMGNPDGSRLLSRDLYWSILRKQLTLTGSWNSSFGTEDSDWAAAVKAVGSGALAPETVVSHELGMEDLPKGLDIMRHKRVSYCKLVVNW